MVARPFFASVALRLFTVELRSSDPPVSTQTAQRSGAGDGISSVSRQLAFPT
jgi:hypothetical protein